MKKNLTIVDQIDELLKISDMESVIAVRDEKTAISVPEKWLGAMKSSDAAIISVTVEEERKDENGEFLINNNVLIEIGAAMALYDKRIVLLWDKRLEVPSNLQGLYRSTFEGNELSLQEGMKLMKVLKELDDVEELMEPE